MLDSTTNKVRAALVPLLERWKTFLVKVEARVGEVEAESEAGLDELLRINPLDPGPISAGISSVQSRFQGLRQKVEQAVEKIEGEWEEATGDLDLEGAALQTVNREWESLRRQERDFTDSLDLRREKLLARKQADWARILLERARQECARERACPLCGARYTPDIQHAASNVQCAHCGAVNEVDPGSATSLYYQGGGLHHLAAERTFPFWEKMTAAERAYQRLRCPTEDDRNTYMTSVREYWLAYYRATKQLHPGFGQAVEEAAAAKVSQYEANDAGVDKKARSLRQKVLALAKAGSRSELAAVLKREPNADLGELAAGVYEHGDRAGAELVLQIQYEHEGVEDDRAEWLREKLAELGAP